MVGGIDFRIGYQTRVVAKGHFVADPSDHCASMQTRSSCSYAKTGWEDLDLAVVDYGRQFMAGTGPEG
jgi:hypothetical protein